MVKAWRDLETARRAATGQPPFYDVAVYHCQQAAEKAVKAFLVHHGKPYEKTHDIEVLTDLAGEVDSNFSQLADAADALTPLRHAVSLSERHLRRRTATDRIRRSVELCPKYLRFRIEPSSSGRTAMKKKLTGAEKWWNECAEYEATHEIAFASPRALLEARMIAELDKARRPHRRAHRNSVARRRKLASR